MSFTFLLRRLLQDIIIPIVHSFLVFGGVRDAALNKFLLSMCPGLEWRGGGLDNMGDLNTRVQGISYPVTNVVTCGRVDPSHLSSERDTSSHA